MHKLQKRLRDAVRQACELDGGGKMKLKAFMKVVNCHFVKTIEEKHYRPISTYRAEWRREHGDMTNCSTYEGQPARSIDNSEPTLPQMRRMQKLMAGWTSDANVRQGAASALQELFGEADSQHRFNDIAQVERCIAAVMELQVDGEWVMEHMDAAAKAAKAAAKAAKAA